MGIECGDVLRGELELEGLVKSQTGGLGRTVVDCEDTKHSIVRKNLFLVQCLLLLQESLNWTHPSSRNR